MDEALRQVGRLESPSLIENNRRFHQRLVERVDVEVQLPARADGGISGDKVALIDFDDPGSNDWLAVNQFRLEENRKNRRPDVVVFVNGLPLARHRAEEPGGRERHDPGGLQPAPDLQEATFPTLFSSNELLVVSDGLEARVGTLTADWERFMPWRTDRRRDRGAAEARPELDVLLKGVFDKAPVPRPAPELHRLRGRRRPSVAKKLAGYHQFHAVNKAVDCTVRRPRPRATAGSA